VYLGSFFLEPEDIKGISLGAICKFSKQQGSHKSIWGAKGPSFKAYVHQDREVLNPIAIIIIIII
jgi:hypothetical protein